MHPKFIQPFTEEQIIQKLESYCAYRERCEIEVKQKLFTLGVEEERIHFFLNYLKENNFLNEERFTASFTRGKFNIKHWGKRKITQALQQKKIDTKKIQHNIGNLDEGLYFLTLQDLLEKKSNTIKEKDEFKKKQKLFQYALQKGYESELVFEALKFIKIS